MLQPKKKVPKSKIKTLESNIRTLKFNKENLKSKPKESLNIKTGEKLRSNADIKKIKSMNSTIKKHKAKLKELKGSGGGSITYKSSYHKDNYMEKSLKEQRNKRSSTGRTLRCIGRPCQPRVTINCCSNRHRCTTWWV